MSNKSDDSNFLLNFLFNEKVSSLSLSLTLSLFLSLSLNSSLLPFSLSLSFPPQALLDDDVSVRKRMLDAAAAMVRFHGNAIASQVVVPFLETVLALPPPARTPSPSSVRSTHAKDMEQFDLLQEGGRYIVI